MIGDLALLLLRQSLAVLHKHQTHGVDYSAGAEMLRALANGFCETESFFFGGEISFIDPVEANEDESKNGLHH